MEDPTKDLPCPDCDGKGYQLIFDTEQLEEYEEECSLCLGKGVLHQYQYRAFKQECRENYREVLVAA